MESHFARKTLKNVSATGELLNISVSPDAIYRRVWCYYQPTSINSAPTFITDLVFTDRGGNELLRLPAMEKDSNGCLLGVATSSWAQLNFLEDNYTYPGGITAPLVGVARSPQPFGMNFFPRSNTSECGYIVTPFTLPIACASIRLETNLAAQATWALLACASSSAPV